MLAGHLDRHDAEAKQVSDAARADAPDQNGGKPMWYDILKDAEPVGQQISGLISGQVIPLRRS